MAVFHGTHEEYEAEKRRIAANQANSLRAQMQNSTRLGYVQRLMNPDQLADPDYNDRLMNAFERSGAGALSARKLINPEFSYGEHPKPEHVPTGTFFDPTPAQRVYMFMFVLGVLVSIGLFAWTSPFVLVLAAGAAYALVNYHDHISDRRRAKPDPPDPTPDDLLKYHYQELADFDAKLREAMKIEDKTEDE